MSRSTIQKYEKDHALTFQDAAVGRVKGKGNWKRLLPRALCRIAWPGLSLSQNTVTSLSLSLFLLIIINNNNY